MTSDLKERPAILESPSRERRVCPVAPAGTDVKVSLELLAWWVNVVCPVWPENPDLWVFLDPLDRLASRESAAWLALPDNLDRMASPAPPD